VRNSFCVSFPLKWKRLRITDGYREKSRGHVRTNICKYRFLWITHLYTFGWLAQVSGLPVETLIFRVGFLKPTLRWFVTPWPKVPSVLRATSPDFGLVKCISLFLPTKTEHRLKWTWSPIPGNFYVKIETEGLMETPTMFPTNKTDFSSRNPPGPTNGI